MAKFCQKCGTELKKDDTFCSNCGTSVEEATSEKATVTKTTTTSSNGQAKSKIAGGLLGIFLGCFGVHNFYLGYTGKAIAQLLISVLSCGFLSPVSAIWGLIEGILILTGSINTDADGNELVD